MVNVESIKTARKLYDGKKKLCSCECKAPSLYPQIGNCTHTVHTHMQSFQPFSLPCKSIPVIETILVISLKLFGFCTFG